jgi:DNA mismatch endonuclease Vsr
MSGRSSRIWLLLMAKHRSRSPVPRFEVLRPASARASAAARGASRKRDTRCEILLRRALWALGLRYRVDVGDLPGRPDIVFRRARVAVFCDGDYWHGRDLEARLKKLARGHNPAYWVAKIRANVLLAT